MINEKEKEKKEKKFRTVFVMAAMRRRMYAITLLPSLVIFYLKFFGISMCNDLRNIWPKILSDGNKVRRNLQRCEVIRKYRMVLLPNR
jgi:hypothetical protein